MDAWDTEKAEDTVSLENDEECIVFEISSDEQKFEFIAWILDISEQEFNQGSKFLEDHNTSFCVLWRLFSYLDVFTVTVENYYVDRVYRDSYYFYFSSKHFNYARFCKRLCLFYGRLEKDFYDYLSGELEEIFMGSIVLRPIANRSIGRTLLNPRYFLPHEVPWKIRLAEYNVTVYGKKLHIRAFPYSMQDGETTSCAEITILNLLDYYSESYPEYHYILPSEISKLAEMNSFERRMPTTGLSYELISKIFCEVGFYPRLYSAQKMAKTKFRHMLYYYIESGIPVALGLKLGDENKHSVISIGHVAPDKEHIGRELSCAYDSQSRCAIWICDTADTVGSYCIMDDNKTPYQFSLCTEEKDDMADMPLLKLDGCEVEYMMVPLYKRMIMEAADAYDICLTILASVQFGIKDFMHRYMPEECGTKENPVVVRLFMASSRTFRKARDEQFQEKNHEVRDLYNMTIFPKFIWVCELATRELYAEGRVMGEVIIDATSSADRKTDSFIIIHYPGVICRRMPEDCAEARDAEFEEIKDWHLFQAFHDDLDTNAWINSVY